MSNFLKSKSLFKSLNLLSLITGILIFSSISCDQLYGQSLTTEELRSRAVWEASSLDLTLDLTKEVPVFKGTMTLVTDSNNSKGPVLALNNREVSMKMTNLEVVGVTDNEVKIFEQTNPNINRNSTLFVIDLEPSIQNSKEIMVNFEYTFVAEQGQVLQRENLSYASWVTGWYPFTIADSKSLSSIKNLSIPGTTSFMLPKDWHALSNGKLVNNEGNKQTWEIGSGIARSYIAAPFNVSSVTQGDIEIKMYLLSDDESVNIKKAKTFAKIIDVLENAFGDYPYDTFALAEIPDFTTDYFGASSEQGFIVAESRNFKGDDGVPLFAHEVGHSWWGNLFSCIGNGASLCSEGLAQFGSILAIEKLYDKEVLRDFMDVSVPSYSDYQSARGYFAMLRSNVDEPLFNIESSSWKVHRLMDSKGMWFWQMLRNELGDELMFKILKDLSQQNQQMTLEDVQLFFKNKSGIDLDYFFDQWLKRKGAPIIDMVWETPIELKSNEYLGDLKVESILLGDKITKRSLNIKLAQEQTNLYRLKVPIEVQFYYGPSEMHLVELNERDISLELIFEKNIKNVILDPNHTILMWRPAYGPKPISN